MGLRIFSGYLHMNYTPWQALLLISLLTQAHLASASIPSKLETGAEQETYSLSETVSKNVNPLLLETPEAQQQAKAQAELYIKLRSGSLRAKDKQSLMAECEKAGQRTFFCKALQGEQENDSPPQRASRCKLKSKTSLAQMISWFKRAELDHFSDESDGLIQRSLQSLKTLESLEPTFAHLTNQHPCQHLRLVKWVGAYGESFLPNPDVQRKLIQLYEAQVNCSGGAQPTTGAQNAKDVKVTTDVKALDDYLWIKLRVGLLHIWNNEFKEALPHLNSIVAQPTPGVFTPRAHFWAIYCQNQLKDELNANQSKLAFLKQFPFSFYALLLHKEKNPQTLPLPIAGDSRIQYRHPGNPYLNDKIKLADALLDLKKFELAKEVIETLEEDVENTPAEVKLYVAVLHQRVSLYLKNFRLLSNLFKDRPNLISKAALELYYPRTSLNLEDAMSYGINDNLILALIRQESAFNAKARSSAGALGLMQVMPGTARNLGSIRKPQALYNPITNLKIGSRFFALLLKRYNGDAELALAAYNAGPKRVDEWLKRYPVKNPILFLDLIPFRETREYVSSIARGYFWYSTLYPRSGEKPSKQSLISKAIGGRLGEVFQLLGT